MPRHVIVSPAAIRQLAEITSYLSANFQTSILEKYLVSWEQFLQTVGLHPHRYPFYETQNNKRLHKVILLKLTVILYTISDDTVVVEAIFDGRSDWQSKLVS